MYKCKIYWIKGVTKKFLWIKKVFIVVLEVIKLSQLLITLGKLLHRMAAAEEYEQPSKSVSIDFLSD